MLFKNYFSSKSCFLKTILFQNLTRCKNFNSKSDASQNFLFKISFLNCVFRFWLNYYQSATRFWLMAVCKRFFYECVICVCLTFATIFFFIAFFMALGFLMGVLTISFALPIDLYKSLWLSKNG